MKRWLIALIPLITLGWLLNWRFTIKKAEAQQQDQQRAARKTTFPLVAAAEVLRGDLEQRFEGVGTVEASGSVNITPEVTGPLVFLQVREGDRVTEGQVLARIDPLPFEAQVRQQRAALLEAQSRLEQARIGQSPSDTAITTSIRQQEAMLASAQADLRQAQQNQTALVASAQAEVINIQGRIAGAVSAMAAAKAAIRSAQASLENAQVAFTRSSELFKKGFVSAQEVDDKRTLLNVREAGVESAKEQLNTAISTREAARLAQKQAAEQQVQIARTKGETDIAAAQARLDAARASLDSARANTAQKPAYVQNLAALKASVEVAKASLGGALSRLKDTVLKSPLNGYVTARYMDVGSVPAVGQAVVSVQEIRQVWVSVPVPADISPKILPGMTVQAAFDSLPGQPFSGKVTQINPSADPLSRQFTIRVTVENPRNSLRPGMFARVKAVIERTSGATLVPREAVQTGKDGAVVMVVNAQSGIERRAVTTGASDARQIAIVQGVHPGEKVVIMTGSPLKEGQQVRTNSAPGR